DRPGGGMPRAHAALLVFRSCAAARQTESLQRPVRAPDVRRGAALLRFRSDPEAVVRLLQNVRAASWSARRHRGPDHRGDDGHAHVLEVREAAGTGAPELLYAMMRSHTSPASAAPQLSHTITGL